MTLLNKEIPTCRNWTSDPLTHHNAVCSRLRQRFDKGKKKPSPCDQTTLHMHWQSRAQLCTIIFTEQRAIAELHNDIDSIDIAEY